jgi:hypothetical protein
MYVITGGNQTGTVDSSGNISTNTSPTYTTPVTVGYTYLTVIDPKTGDNLWVSRNDGGICMPVFTAQQKV